MPRCGARRARHRRRVTARARRSRGPPAGGASPPSSARCSRARRRVRSGHDRPRVGRPTGGVGRAVRSGPRTLGAGGRLITEARSLASRWRAAVGRGVAGQRSVAESVPAVRLHAHRRRGSHRTRTLTSDPRFVRPVATIVTMSVTTAVSRTQQECHRTTSRLTCRRARHCGVVRRSNVQWGT